MQTIDRIDWEILDATADDCENLEQIYLTICYDCQPLNNHKLAQWGLSYQRNEEVLLLHEVADHVRSLVEKGLLEAAMDENGRSVTELKDLSLVWRGWFRMTHQGRQLWENSPIPSDAAKAVVAAAR